jgi:hypothetical protein
VPEIFRSGFEARRPGFDLARDDVENDGDVGNCTDRCFRRRVRCITIGLDGVEFFGREGRRGRQLGGLAAKVPNDRIARERVAECVPDVSKKSSISPESFEEIFLSRSSTAGRLPLAQPFRSVFRFGAERCDLNQERLRQ